MRKTIVSVASLALCLGALAATQASAATKAMRSSGGSLVLTATVKNAQKCIWSSTPKIAGFAKTVKCRNGLVSNTAKFKANTSTRSKNYEISLKVSGKNSTTFRWTVIQAGVKPPTTTTSTTTTTTKPLYGLGVTQRVHDASQNALAVDVAQIFDPATGIDQFNQPNAGYRFVAVEINLSNQSTGTISDDANLDVQVIGSTNQAYSPDFSSVTECTDFSSGSFTLLPGGTESGCVLFQVPLGIQVKVVQFSLGYGFLDVAQWNL